MSGLKNAFYQKLNQVRHSERPLIERVGAVGAILINERGDLKALPIGRIRAGPSKDLLWKNPDFSVRYLLTDSDRVTAVFEDVCHSSIECAAAMGEEVMFVGHSDTTITVWVVDQKLKISEKIKVLRAHSGPVKVLRAIPEYGILISGCESGRVVVWDISHFHLIRLLTVMPEAIKDLRACWITGDLFVATERRISVFTINGIPLGCVMSENITCVAAPAGREWERPRILLSGHNDGTIRVWARELVPCRSPNSSSGSLASSGSLTDNCWTMSGALWEERLVMRGKLALPVGKTLNPVGITSFGISHDHSKFYTGDEQGRVFSWTS